MAPGRLSRLAGGAFVRHRRVIVVWVLVLVALVVGVEVTGPHLKNSFTVPGTNSQQALDVLNKNFPSETQPTALIAVYDPQGRLSTPAGTNVLNAAFGRMSHLPDVAHVTPPFNIGKYLPATISRSDKLAVGKVSYDGGYGDLGGDTLTALTKATAPVRALGMHVYYGGPVVDYLAAESGLSKYADELGLVVAAVLLILLFRSVLSALLPLFNALAGLGAGILALHMLANVFDIGSTAPDLAAMIGLGVGIDYGLFLTARYRQELVHTPDRREAAARAMTSTGTAVLFSGIVVCLATAGLALAGIPYVTMLGLCAGLSVLVMLVGCIMIGLNLGTFDPEWKRRFASAIRSSPASSSSSRPGSASSEARNECSPDAVSRRRSSASRSSSPAARSSGASPSSGATARSASATRPAAPSPSSGASAWAAAAAASASSAT